MTLHPIRPGIGYGSVAGQALGPASPADRDATRSAAERRDGLTPAKLLVRQESAQQRQAWIEGARQDLIMARRVSLEDTQPVGIRELARQIAEYIEPRLNAAMAIAEREG